MLLIFNLLSSLTKLEIVAKYLATLTIFFYPLQARDGITELHFLPFNPVDKRTAITYIDSQGNWHRVSKGAPEQVGDLLLHMNDVSFFLIQCPLLI